MKMEMRKTALQQLPDDWDWDSDWEVGTDVARLRRL